jgi:hypothetical protein
LLSDSSFKGKCPRLHVNHVPQPQRNIFPYGWLQMADSDDFPCLDDAQGETSPGNYFFDMEFYAENDSDALACATLAKAKLNNFRGSMGSGARTAQAIFAKNQSNEYIPRGLGSDIGEHWVALAVRVIA